MDTVKQLAQDAKITNCSRCQRETVSWTSDADPICVQCWAAELEAREEEETRGLRRVAVLCGLTVLVAVAAGAFLL